LIDGLYSPSGVRIAKAAGSQAPERLRLFFRMSDQKQQPEFGSHPKPIWSSLWQAKLAKLRREILAPPSSKGGGAGEGFDVTKSGDSRVGLVGFPSVGKSTLLNKLTGTFSEVGSSLPHLFVMFAYNVMHVMACAGYGTLVVMLPSKYCCRDFSATLIDMLWHANCNVASFCNCHYPPVDVP